MPAIFSPYYNLSRLLLILLLFYGCGSKHRGWGEANFIVDSGKATSLFIPSDLIIGINPDSIDQQLSVRLTGAQSQVIGELKHDGYGVRFTPPLPFRPGMTYEVYYRNRIIASLSPPESDAGQAPVLSRIYPSADTVPENLLKIYLDFSQPMSTGKAPEHVFLIRDNGDTVRGAFLEQTNELWDRDNRRLTLWLHPGRIKRGLKPNEAEGAPLTSGNAYRIVVRKGWPAATGNPTESETVKQLIAGTRDSIPPDIAKWKINVPAPGSRQALRIQFHEKIDRVLAAEAISISGPSAEELRGNIVVLKGESGLLFHPDSPWKPGNYVINAESRLEDLAGNNLNRPFDRDVRMKQVSSGPAVHRRAFRIE